MKKIIAVVLVLMLIFGMTACSGSNADEPDTAVPNNNGTNEGTVKGTDNTDAAGSSGQGVQMPEAIMTVKIMNIDGSEFLAANMDEGANSADIYKVKLEGIELLDMSGGKTDIGGLKTGMLIDIAYDGAVMESFPMQLGGIKSVRIKEEGDDLACLYMKVISDLYEIDPGLNDRIQRMAFDLSKTSNLKETEKTALVYMAGNEFGLETLRGTFDELCEQGYIDKERLYFETGLLFTIEVESENSGSFVFDAQKWRSGLGAYFFIDCTAKKENGGWTYTIGSQAIS